MPWYIHLYHASWTALVGTVGVIFGFWTGLALLCLIVIVSIAINT